MPRTVENDTVRFYEPRTTALRLEDARRTLLAEREALESFGVSRLSICGSVARNEARPDSDLDLIVEMDLSTNPAGRYFGVIEYLEDRFHCEIDLLIREGIKPHARESIARDAVPVF